MTQATKTWVCSKDSFVAQEIGGSTNYGSGKCSHLALGRSINAYGPVRQRALLDFTEDWAGVVQIVKAELKMHVPTNPYHVDLGGSNYVRAQRISAAWSEGTQGADEVIRSSNSVHWGNQPGVTGTASAAVSVPGANSWITVDITDIIEAIAPNTVKLRSGAMGSGSGTWEGLRVIPTDSGGTEQTDASAQASEFNSRESSSDPYVLITYDNNTAPAVPTISTPVADAIASSAAGTTAVISGTYSDPDGDAFGGGTIQIYDDAATDDGAGNILTGTKIGADRPMVAGDGSGASWSKSVTGLPAQTWVKARVQVKDSKGAFSIYCPLRRFKTNATPGVPTNPYFQDDTVDNPTVAFSLSDPDGTAGSPPPAYISAYSIEVYYDHPTLGAIPMWIVSKTTIGGTSTRVSVTYNGETLVIGTKYRWKAWVWDNNDVQSPSTGDLYVTPTTSTGPSNMTPRDVETKQNSRTPTLTIAHSANFDQYALDVYDNENGIGTPLWTVPTQTIASAASKALTYGDNTGLVGATTAVALEWGRRYYWRSAVRVTGNLSLGAYSPIYPFYVNALPSAPSISVGA